jgi:hypothetical protein
MSKKNSPLIYDHTHSTYLSSIAQKIFMIIVVLYLLVDLSERLLNVRFESWIYAILFAGITLSIFITGISFLERTIMSKLNS